MVFSWNRSYLKPGATPSWRNSDGVSSSSSKPWQLPGIETKCLPCCLLRLGLGIISILPEYTGDCADKCLLPGVSHMCWKEVGRGRTSEVYHKIEVLGWLYHYHWLELPLQEGVELLIVCGNYLWRQESCRWDNWHIKYVSVHRREAGGMGNISEGTLTSKRKEGRKTSLQNSGNVTLQYTLIVLLF